MLLLIALAHAHMYLAGNRTGFRGYDLDGSAVDRVVAAVQVLLVDGRALPMFAALFGYGLVRLADRLAGRLAPAEPFAGRFVAGPGTTARTAAGTTAGTTVGTAARTAAATGPGGADGSWPHVRRVLRRRSLWLLAFGACHALLLFFGDILGAYGLIGLLLIGFLRRDDRDVLRAAGVGLLLHVVVIGAFGLLTVHAPKGDTPAAMADPVGAAVARVVAWTAMTPTWFVASAVPTFLLGIWAARRRLLDEPGRHRALLRRVAVAGVGAAVVGGLPLMLVDAGLWAPPAAVSVPAYVLHSVAGVAGGLGYAALVGLVAARVGERRGPVVGALVACGQWSLTCYLLQSVVFVAVFAPYAGGVGLRAGDAAASGIAVVTWLGTVVLASLPGLRGRRGPAESLLRRLTYGRSG
ncbi:DUF418 domain-containing protein [Actinosynnema sp. NPDC059797]